MAVMLHIHHLLQVLHGAPFVRGQRLTRDRRLHLGTALMSSLCE